jgi:hypothetical protein
MKPYQPVARHVEERLEIAILTGEVLNLHWAEEEGDAAFMAKVIPLEVHEEEGKRWLRARADTGDEIEIRLDLIRNLPTPVK